MELSGKVIAITGAGSGIGRAMALRFAREDPRALYVADIDSASIEETAAMCGARAVSLDVSDQVQISSFVRARESEGLGIDLFCSNAGIAVAGFEAVSSELWQRSWDINVMAHVHAASAVLPYMIARGGGYLLHTVSAAGLLTNLGAAPYSVTKHAAQAFAEWLYATYRHLGIRVSSLCPQGVNTPLIDAETFNASGTVARDAITTSAELLDPAAVAEAALEGIRNERFLILPHPEVKGYFATRAGEMDRWLSTMSKIQQKLESAAPQ